MSDLLDTSVSQPVETVAENASVETAPQAVLAETPKGLHDFLGADYKTEKSLQSFKSVDDLAKGYINAVSLVGKRVTDMTPEELIAVGSKFGIPSNPNEYKFDVENVDQELVQQHAALMHKLGISNDAASELLKMKIAENNAIRQEEIKQFEQESLQNIESLKKEFGAQFDTKIALANKALKKFGGDDAVRVIKEYQLDNNPALIKLLAKAGELISEGGLPGSGGTNNMTLEDIDKRISSLRIDPEYNRKIRNGIGREKEEALAEMARLFEMKYRRQV